jgi:LasA protease
MAEPLLPPGLVQPILELPFVPGERWSLTAGPHESWKTGSPRGALDLAPVTGEPHCAVSRAWALASAPGLIVRSERNVAAIDLDGDGFEQTGWVMLYLHLADFERIQAGQWVKVDEPIGHPSCEGGTSTGTHIHIARKFNGEWLAADGPLPFVLSGWQAYADERNYYGGLINGTQQAVASPVGPQTSIIVR